jgi:hypothetical protein
MGHNKWMLGCFGCLVACAIPGGLGIMWAVLALIVCAGGFFWKWLVEEDKYQRAEEEKYWEYIKKKVDK